MNSVFSLSNKTAFITGANSGIGLEVCQLFLSQGSDVIATGLESSKQVNELEEKYPGRIAFYKLDLMTETDLTEAKKIIEEKQPNILFNNAAIFDMGSVLQADINQYHRIFKLNVEVLYQLMQKVSQTLVKYKKQGSIINLSSQAGRRGEALVIHYCASKAAVISYTQSAALALAPYQIRVNAIAPGVVDTQMWDQVDTLFAKFENRPLGEKKQIVAKEVPLGRMAKAIDVANLALFLASDSSSYITGQTINIDGGNYLN